MEDSWLDSAYEDLYSDDYDEGYFDDGGFWGDDEDDDEYDDYEIFLPDRLEMGPDPLDMPSYGE